MLIHQKSRSYVLSLFLYLAFGEYVFAFSGMRQGAAIGLVVMAYLGVMKGNRLKAIIWILLATTIHSSAFIALPILFISKIRVTYSLIEISWRLEKKSRISASTFASSVKIS